MTLEVVGRDRRLYPGTYADVSAQPFIDKLAYAVNGNRGGFSTSYIAAYRRIVGLVAFLRNASDGRYLTPREVRRLHIQMRERYGDVLFGARMFAIADLMHDFATYGAKYHSNGNARSLYADERTLEDVRRKEIKRRWDARCRRRKAGLIDPRTIVRNASESVPCWPVVYFLIALNEIVYVGTTTNVRNRIREHRACKRFDRVYVLACRTVSDALELERQYIREFNPKLNQTHNPLFRLREFT